MGRSSNPVRVKNFLFSTSSRPALGSTQPPIQWVRGGGGVKRQGCGGQVNVDIYIHNHVCLHGVVLN
jgi:hypothetical protein